MLCGVWSVSSGYTLGFVRRSVRRLGGVEVTTMEEYQFDRFMERLDMIYDALETSNKHLSTLIPFITFAAFCVGIIAITAVFWFLSRG